MIKRSFICLSKPRIEYELIGSNEMELSGIPVPKMVTLLLNDPLTHKDTLFQVGDSVKTGQKLSLAEDSDSYVISSVTGTISSVSPFMGDYGTAYTAVSIETAENEVIDDHFKSQSTEPTIETAANYLAYTPGSPSFKLFSDSEKSIHTIVVFGGNTDLLISTNQYIIQTQIDDITTGIGVLKKITGVEKIILAVPRGLVSGFGHTGAELEAVDLSYPSAHPHVIMREVLGQEVPAGKQCEDLGVCFFSAEALASVGKAYTSGQIPVVKTLTLVKKNGAKVVVEARIGTPVSDIFKTHGVSLQEKDRLIIGGPLTGSSIYSEDYPVQPDTDAIIVQDKTDVSLVSDYPCINCGECIRICPVKVPVNMLVRLLEAGLYEEAADEYDLYSCIECGLCSFVCVSKIPVFQYIRLAKYELSRVNTAEATDE